MTKESSVNKVTLQNFDVQVKVIINSVGSMYTYTDRDQI